METWEIAFRTTEGDYTYKLAKWEGDDLKIDIEADRSPFDGQVFYVGSGEMLPRIDRYRIVIREDTLEESDLVLANMLYVLGISYAQIMHGRIKYADWTNDYSIQPTLRGYILDFQFTETTGWQPFTGTLVDIATAPTDPDPYNPTAVSLARPFQAVQVHYSPTKYSYTASFTANAGDLIVFMLMTTYASYTLPSGYTAIHTWTYGSFYGVVAYKTADGSETGFTGVAGLNPTPNNWIMGFAVFRDSLAGTDLDIYDSLYATASDQNFTPTLTDIGTSLGHERWVFAWQPVLASFQPATQAKILDQGNALGLHTLTAWYPISENVNRQTTAGAYHTLMITIGSADSIVVPVNPDPDTGTSDTITALGDLQARSGAGSAKVAHSQFTRAYQARNRTFDASNPSIPLHPSTGFMNIRTSSGQARYFFCYTEIFEITGISGGNITIVSKGSNGLGNATYDRHFQWSRTEHNKYFGVKNGDLLKFTVGSTTPTMLCSRARVLSELGLTAYDSQAVRWPGPSELDIASNTAELGKEMSGGYVRTGEKAFTLYAYNITDDEIPSGVQNVTFTTEAELYFDAIGISPRGKYIVLKTRREGSSLDAQYWVYPLTLSGVGSRILVDSDIDLGHFDFGLMDDGGGGTTDALYTFTDEVFNLIDPSDGSIALTKAVEGQWSQHIGHVYGTIGFTTYDSAGRAAFEYSDGSGGFGLGEGWDAQGYVQMHYDAPTGDVFVIGLRGGVPELRYWDHV